MAHISVLIPTFRRPELLRRAVESVIAQTHSDWSCFICDDEDPAENPADETWDYLFDLARRDPRFRPLRNRGPSGQINAMNTLMAAAHEGPADWFKFLHDDDRLRPHCLAAMDAAVADQPSAVLATCGVAEYRDDRYLRDRIPPGNATAERIAGPHALLGAYLQDDVGGGVPTQLMVRRTLVDRGVRWRRPHGVRTVVDSVFCNDALEHGDSIVVRAPLVEWHQGAHDSVTSATSDAALDREYAALRAIQLASIDPALQPPPLRVALQSLRLIRATQRCSRRRFLDAARLALGAWHPQAWTLWARWLMRRAGRPSHSSIPRIPIDSTRLDSILATGTKPAHPNLRFVPETSPATHLAPLAHQENPIPIRRSA